MHKGGWGGGVDCKMDLLTSLKIIFSVAFMFSLISIWGGGAYITQNQNVTLTQNPTFSFLGRGVHCLPVLGRLE